MKLRIEVRIKRKKKKSQTMKGRRGALIPNHSLIQWMSSKWT